MTASTNPSACGPQATAPVRPARPPKEPRRMRVATAWLIVLTGILCGSTPLSPRGLS